MRVIHRGLLAGAVLSLAACHTESIPVDPFRDPPRIRTDHYKSRVSPDGTQLAYIERSERGGGLHVLDLRSGADVRIGIRSRLPANVVSCTASLAIWCPYDRNRLLVHCLTTTRDTVAGLPHNHYDQNAYVISLDRDSIWRVTPSRYGPTGAGNGLVLLAWRYGSTVAVDSIHQGGGEIYIPQQDVFVPADAHFMSQSPNGRHTFGAVWQGLECTMELDGRPIGARALPFPKAVAAPEYVSWSPSGRLLLILVRFDSNRYENWLLDIDEYERSGGVTIPAWRLRLQDATSDSGAGEMEFLTDSTVAVNIVQSNPDSTASALLWEYKVDGTLIRQLTFEP